MVRPFDGLRAHRERVLPAPSPSKSARIVVTLAWLGIWWGLVLWLGVTILIDRSAQPQALTAAGPQPIPPAPSPKPPGKPIPPAPNPPPKPEPIPPAPVPSP